MFSFPTSSRPDRHDFFSAPQSGASARAGVALRQTIVNLRGALVSVQWLQTFPIGTF